MVDHDCTFPEVVIMANDEDSALKKGMHVLIPCPVCGETPYDSSALMHSHIAEMEESIKQLQPDRALYHWSPAIHRKQITRYGLRPSMRSTTSSEGYKAPYVCFADTPSWAWALSGDMPHAPKGEWDLWMTWLDRLKDANLLNGQNILPSTDRPSGIYEVRVPHRVHKRHLWYVGSRTK